MSKKQTKKSTSKPTRRWPLHLHHRGSQLIILLVLAGLILISHFGRANLQMPAAKIPATPNQVLITLSGFSPPVLTVKAGSPVTWSNEDTRPHQIAADTSTDNPPLLGFDDSLILRTGDSYTFSFIHPGTYTYHDQLNPFQLQGSVIVK